jgi:cytochrome c-type biogenesis protein CcmH/NrfG
MIRFGKRPTDTFVASPPPRGLPPRTYLPIVLVIAVVFLGTMFYLVALGFGVTGSVFGKTATQGSAMTQAQSAGSATSVQGGGPPAAVVGQIRTLRERIAAHPNDDVTITQLADMYLAANKFSEAIPLYQRALKINPSNVAAQTGLSEAKESLREQGTQ